MAGFQDSELERLVNEIAENVDTITDEMAVNSDFGGDSDAEDDLPTSTGNIEKMSTRNDPSTSQAESESESDIDDLFDNDSNNMFERYGTPPMSSDQESDPISDVDTDDFEWSKQASDPCKYSKAVFSEKIGPNYTENCNSPIDFFNLFFTPFFVCEIVSQSNLYAQQHGTNLLLTIEELRAWFGILIFMGFHYLPGIRLYWSVDENFHCERIARIMPVKRFLKILRFLHVADNSEMPKRGDPNFDRLYKIKPFLEYFGEKFKTNFCPSQFLSIDESMVAFKGRNTMKQYMPMKPIKRGFKVWVMCCATTGYVVAFDVYTGKNNSDGIEGTLGERVVLRLARGLEGLFYCVFFDNFFTSVKLVWKLLSKKIFSCGTIRMNRKHLPVNQINQKLKQHEIDYAMSGDISFVRWVDRGKKPVAVLSSMHNASKVTVVKRTNREGKKEEVPCPEAISDYNKYMGGVDRMDQMHAAYSVARKSRRWWIKLFYYFFDMAIINAFVIFKEWQKQNNVSKPMTQLQFRSLLVNELIGKFTNKKRGYQPGLDRNRKKSKVLTVTNTVRLSDVGSHLPEVVKGYRRCAQCSSKAKEKRSNIICKACNVALCKGCFAHFHQND